MGLRGKFNLLLVCVCLLGLAISGAVSYWMARQHAREDVIQDARILHRTALAIRGYTANEIAPLLRPMIEDQFLPHTVPSFAAQYNFRTLQDSYPDYSYKEAALNPTNLNDKATPWEAEIIEAFRNQPELSEQVVVRRDDAGTELLTLANPIRIEDEGCLRCHGDPADAPESMRVLYGTENGFGWEMGEVVGAQLVSVPTSVSNRRAMKEFGSSMAMIGGVFALIIFVIDVGLHYIVIRPVKRISQVADEVSMGDLDAAEYEHKSKDEIGTLSASFNRMRRSLTSAMRMIDS